MVKKKVLKLKKKAPEPEPESAAEGSILNKSTAASMLGGDGKLVKVRLHTILL